MRVHVLEREQRIAAPPEEVFPFFEDAYNLESLTRPFLGFHLFVDARRLDFNRA
jgi:ligand-binding SRPBCC domain-containing protein